MMITKFLFGGLIEYGGAWMITGKVTIKNELGIHARTAAKLVSVAMNCQSDIQFQIGENRLDPKNIMELMGASIRCGTEIVIECSGKTEKEDLEKLVQLIESGLGE